MIRRLRRRHRVMTSALVLAVAGSAVALAMRPSEAVMEALPPPLQGAAPSAEAVWSGDDLWTGASIKTTFYADHLVLSPTEPLRKPDCLLYWAPAAGDGKGIPEGAVLLGALSEDPEQRIRMPAGTSTTDGFLFIYSLGHSEVFATMPLRQGGMR